MKKMIVPAIAAGIVAALSIVAPRPTVAQEQIAYNVAKPAVALDRATLSLEQLEARLRETPGLGFWSKLWLKGELTEIFEDVGRHSEGSDEQDLETLRARFFSLADETARKLRSADPGLSNTIASSRDAIWEAVLRR